MILKTNVSGAVMICEIQAKNLAGCPWANKSKALAGHPAPLDLIGQ
jgi:hypothetical protein